VRTCRHPAPAWALEVTVAVVEEGTGMNAIANLKSDGSVSASAIATIALRAIEQGIVAAAGASRDNR
jgi:hypothetical protein